jgi:prepilin-type processing-associated H-X9-DG protein
MPGDKNAAPSHGRPTLSVWAIASMCLGMALVPLAFVLVLVLRINLSPIIMIILVIITALLGHIAIVSINKNPQRHCGKGIAHIGIATGGSALILMMILLPSMGKAREGRGPPCLANLKALGTATYMYQQDYNGYFPAPAGKTPAYKDWIFWQPGRDINKSLFCPYMGNTFISKVYICPQDTSALKRPANTYQYSYSANVNVFILEGTTEPGIPNKPLRFSSVQNPANKIVLVEEDSAGIDDGAWEPQNWKAGYPKNALSLRHDKMATATPMSGRSNVNFMDGHSEATLRADAMTPRFYDPLVP